MSAEMKLVRFLSNENYLGPSAVTLITYGDSGAPTSAMVNFIDYPGAGTWVYQLIGSVSFDTLYWTNAAMTATVVKK